MRPWNGNSARSIACSPGSSVLHPEIRPFAPPPNPPAAAQRSTENSARLALRGIRLNALLAAVKFAGGIFGHTYALIADGAESTLDIFSSLLVWAGFRVAARPPDADHPYGHGKAESLAALAVALFIFLMAGWIALHAVHEIITPHLRPAWWTLLVLAAVIVTKMWFSRRIGAAGEQAGSTGHGIAHAVKDALISSVPHRISDVTVHVEPMKVPACPRRKDQIPSSKPP